MTMGSMYNTNRVFLGINSISIDIDIIFSGLWISVQSFINLELEMKK